ncbi:putative transporter [Trachipleistophora hominis]|uniref:Putative transporter n=1 Tax=Trachipleistophora hominis TaxID=72359 RepID=L7JUH2_TRAHO|nr:putative transporter [Trachipleistophora hominis]
MFPNLLRPSKHSKINNPCIKRFVYLCIMNCVKRRTVCTSSKKHAIKTPDPDTKGSRGRNEIKPRTRIVMAIEFIAWLMKDIVFILLFNSLVEVKINKLRKNDTKAGILRNDKHVIDNEPANCTRKINTNVDNNKKLKRGSYLYRTLYHIRAFFLTQYGILKEHFYVYHERTSIINNAMVLAVPCVKTVIFREYYPISTYLLHNVLLSLTMKVTGIPIICIFLYQQKVSHLQIYFALALLMFILEERGVAVLAQSFLVLHRFMFIIPVIVMTAHKVIENYLNRKKIQFLSLTVVVMPVIIYAVRYWLSKEQFEETDMYVIDRAVVQIRNQHGDMLEGKYEIIKVHEEDDEPAEIKEEERETSNYKIDETNNTRSDNEQNNDIKDFVKGIAGTIRSEKDDLTGKIAVDASENDKEKAVKVENKHNNEKQNTERQHNKDEEEKKRKIQKNDKGKQKHNNNPDSFIRQNELIRLKHIETSKFISSTTDKVDQKFYKIEMRDSNDQGFSLWRISSTDKNNEYIRAREFFRLKNANTNLMLGIRSDGMLNGSNESKITRQTFMITECTNHAYYKMVQDSENMLRMANEKTRAPDRVSRLNVDLSVNVADLLKFCVIVCVILFNYVLYRRYDFVCVMDDNLSMFLIFLGCNVFLSTEFFAYVQYLIVLLLTKKLIVATWNFVHTSSRKV